MGGRKVILTVVLQVPFNLTGFQKDRIEAALVKITSGVFPRSQLELEIKTSGGFHNEGVVALCAASNGEKQDQLDLQHAVRLALHGLARDGFEEFSNNTLQLAGLLSKTA